MLRMLCLLAFVALPLSSWAATIDSQPTGAEACRGDVELHVFLRGRITAGDADALKRHIESRWAEIGRQSVFCDNNTLLHLDSPGGLWSEGLALANYVYENDLATQIDAGAACLSACGVVFLSGFDENGGGETYRPDRTLHVDGVLGLHAPYVDPPEGNYTHADLVMAYELGVKAQEILRCLHLKSC